MYQPTVAKWVSYDPLLMTTDTNLFQYVTNTPNVQIDPSGLLAVHAICGTLCIGCGFCVYPALDVCLNSPFPFAECMQDFWDALPLYAKIICGGLACGGCSACVIRYVVRVLKPPKPPVVRPPVNPPPVNPPPCVGRNDLCREAYGLCLADCGLRFGVIADPNMPPAPFGIAKCITCCSLSLNLCNRGRWVNAPWPQPVGDCWFPNL